MKLILLSFALGLFLGLYLAYMYGVASFSSGAAPVRNTPAQVVKKEAAQVEAVTGKQMDSLVRSNKRLQSELAVTKAALQVAKGKALQQQKKSGGSSR